jgi:hypothetical protein
LGSLPSECEHATDGQDRVYPESLAVPFAAGEVDYAPSWTLTEIAALLD